MHMLNNNTAPMWFVIGALVVGWGIVLKNCNLSEVFTEVVNSFKDFNAEGNHPVDDFSFYYNLIPPELAYKTYGSVRKYKPEFTSTVDFAPYIDSRRIEQHYALRFEAKSLDTSKSQTALICMQNHSTSRYSIHFGLRKRRISINKYIKLTEDWQTFKFNYVHFNRTSTFDKDDKSMFALHGEYDTGNIPLVKNIVLIPTEPWYP